MVADDLAVMSDTARGLQHLVLEARDDASRERYTYNATKTKVVGNKKQIAVAKENLEIYLNNTIIQTSDQETHVGTPCPLCREDEESMAHFLLSCPATEHYRQPYIQQISNTLHTHCIRSPESKDQAVCLILDPSNHTSSTDAIDDLIPISRNLCYKLHHRRNVPMGLGSSYRGVLTKRGVLKKGRYKAIQILCIYIIQNSTYTEMWFV